ncbi:MAG: NADH-quinone oxidoreductase subunit C [Alistipes sp.]|nr:NADH-quinone oxidoreductase subunit C [Alistipes sp.]
MNWYITDNTAPAVALDKIPEASYADFYNDLAAKLADARCHVAHYFALPLGDRLRFFCLLLDDAAGQVLLASHAMGYYDQTALPSLTALHPALHPFERDIAERYGVRFDGMPWPKPLRFPADRRDRSSTMDNYPFYSMKGGSLHEVNVGPIHAGIIEPGAFRFICNGEQVLHLEIALGYQHRGVERLLGQTGNLLRQMCLAEAVAGDSAVAHATAFAEAVEKLTGHQRPAQLERERTVALELERMAMQIADTGALSMDVGYQLGQVACEALRTMTINTTQAWCGNRFGKGLIRPHGTDHPLTPEKARMIRSNVGEIARRYDEVRRDLKSSPSLLARFEQCGIVPREEMQRIGGVGQAARASGLARDIRTTHPWASFAKCLHHRSIVKQQGDVMARLMVRCREVLQSADYIDRLLELYEQKYAAGPTPCPAPSYAEKAAPSSLSFGLVEGWRGETCHVLVTDAEGRIAEARIKDPSLHNWMALALAVRSEGISDFPICNKSFNLSYCGHDL